MGVKGISTTMYQWDMEYRSRSIDFRDNLEMVFREMAVCGLDGVQSRMAYADTAENAEKLADLCNRSGLRLSSLYGDCMLYDKNLLEREADAFVQRAEIASLSGSRLIAVNMAAPKGRDKTEDEVKTQAEGLNKIGRRLNASGIRIALHNHTPEMKNDAKELKYLMANLAEDNIGICLDISWADMAGVSYTDLIDQYHERLFEIHVRNNIDREQGFSQSVDEGIISYPAIHQQLGKLNYDGWYIVELAYMGGMKLTRSFKENMVRSIWYMKGIISH